MEQGFGRDFGNVRVHSDDHAARLAGAAGARAFAVGRDIVFGKGRFEAGTASGQWLLAHELTHLLQQEAAGPAGAARSSRLQRKMGDGHDLRSPRFSADPQLEACFDDERLIALGDSGDFVAKIQQALVDAGFPLPSFGVDGLFGPETKAAVQAFQRASGLDGPGVDGIVGPITMGLLDARFVPDPSPPSKNCPDLPISQEKDPLPPVPAFSPRRISAPDLLEKVKQMQPPGVPVPRKPPLGASQPSFKTRPVSVKAVAAPGETCMKCVADWDMPAAFQAFVAEGSFSDEPKRFAAIQKNDVSGCPSKPIPDLLEVKKIILPGATPFIVLGEREHYLDFVRAFRMAAGRHLSNVRRLTPDRTHLRGKDQGDCADKVEEFLMRMAGIPLFPTGKFLELFTQIVAEDFQTLYDSAGRDESGAHAATSIPPQGARPTFPNIDTDQNPFGCSAFCRKFDARSFPGVPGASSDLLVQDNDVPQKKPWHVL